MEKRKLFGIILGVVAFVALIAGATYAWFTWASGPTTISGNSAKFVIKYDKGTDIEGAINPSADETGGISGSVTISKTSESIAGTAKLQLTDIVLTNASSGVCSDAKYSTKETCESGSGTWITEPTWEALKYVVKKGNEIIAQGDFSNSDPRRTDGSTITLFTAEPLSNFETSPTTYTVYIWLKGLDAGNEYIGAGLTAKISASAVQTG